MSKICAMVVACIAAFLLCGCGTTEISMNKGRFDVPVHHNFIGVGKELPPKTSINNVTVSLALIPEDSLKIRKLYNDSISSFKKNKIDFNYKLNKFPVMASYTYYYKGAICIAGLGVGFGKYLFGRFVFGINDKHYETGMYGDLGYGFDKGTYDYRYHRSSGISFGGEGYNIYGDSTYSNSYIGHFVTSFGLYASYYYGAFGITYSPSVYAPWQRRDLPVNAQNNGDYDIHFVFPKIISQYLGLSFWITEHWKISGGVTFLTPVDFYDFAMTGNTSVGYWF